MIKQAPIQVALILIVTTLAFIAGRITHVAAFGVFAVLLCLIGLAFVLGREVGRRRREQASRLPH